MEKGFIRIKSFKFPYQVDIPSDYAPDPSITDPNTEGFRDLSMASMDEKFFGTGLNVFLVEVKPSPNWVTLDDYKREFKLNPSEKIEKITISGQETILYSGTGTFDNDGTTILLHFRQALFIYRGQVWIIFLRDGSDTGKRARLFPHILESFKLLK